VLCCVLRGLPRNAGSEGGEARSAGKERRSGARGACLLLAAAAEAQTALHLTAPDVVTHSRQTSDRFLSVARFPNMSRGRVTRAWLQALTRLCLCLCVVLPGGADGGQVEEREDGEGEGGAQHERRVPRGADGEHAGGAPRAQHHAQGAPHDQPHPADHAQQAGQATRSALARACHPHRHPRQHDVDGKWTRVQ